MGDLLSRLRDIRGLDAASWWPPGPGWWFVAALGIILAGVALYLRRRRMRCNAGWRAGMEARLKALRDDREKSVKQKAAELSELMRLIAMQRFGREACAGREGRAWLGWLAQHDPQQFRWDERAAILADAPYMPEGREISADWDEIVTAAERWIR